METLEVCSKKKFVLPLKKKNKAYKFTITNKKIATISKKGVIKGRRIGKTILKVQHKKTKKITKYKIKVVNPVKKIKIKSGTSYFWPACSYKLKATKYPSKNSETIRWSSSNPDIATVKKGKIKIKNTGTVTIYAYTASGKKAGKTIHVYSPRLVFLDGESLTIESNSKHKLNMNLNHYPMDLVTFRSSNNSIATVDAYGQILAKRPGKLNISAITADGTKFVLALTVKADMGQISKSTIDKYGGAQCRKLAIVAHPDDETLWGGGHLKSGDWFIVCLTNGYHTIRSEEYKNVLKKSGNRGVILNYPDLMNGERDDWSYCKQGVMKDLTCVLTYKDWEQIVTYNPDGVTGHKHHLLTFSLVHDLCEQNNLLDKLYYYGVFYPEGRVPDNLPRMTDEEIQFKVGLIECYPNEKVSIELYWDQMIPFENWVLSHDW